MNISTDGRRIDSVRAELTCPKRPVSWVRDYISVLFSGMKYDALVAQSAMAVAEGLTALAGNDHADAGRHFGYGVAIVNLLNEISETCA